MYFTKNLKFLTSTTETNQNQLAKKLNIKRQSITTMLKTEDPKASTLIKISQIYKISIDDLLLKDLEQEVK